MGYVATILVILYYDTDQHVDINRSYCVWFNEYISSLSMENNHTPGYLIFQNILKVFFIIWTCSTLLHAKLILHWTILTYEIEIRPSGRKFSYSLLDDENCAISYIIFEVLDSPVVHQPPPQSKKNAHTLAINGEHLITAQSAIDKFQCHQT